MEGQVGVAERPRETGNAYASGAVSPASGPDETLRVELSERRDYAERQAVDFEVAAAAWRRTQCACEAALGSLMGESQSVSF
jgi:hypothetical protein